MATIGASDVEGGIAARRAGNGIAHRLRISENWENFCFGDTQLSHTLFRVAVSPSTLERLFWQIGVRMGLAEELRKPFTGILECDETNFEDARKRGWGGQQGDHV